MALRQQNALDRKREKRNSNSRGQNGRLKCDQPYHADQPAWGPTLNIVHLYQGKIINKNINIKVVIQTVSLIRGTYRKD